MRRRRTNAATLLETVIAFFVIATGIGVLGGLYAATMGGQADDVEASQIVTLAESRIAQLRALGGVEATFLTLNSESGVVNLTDPAGYRVETSVTNAVVAFPCRGLYQRDYGASYKRVTVKVAGPRGKSLSLVSLIGEPRREAQSLGVVQASGSSPLARDAQADFVASLSAAAGGTIEDLEYRFYIDFGRGYGRLAEDSDGKTVHFFNQILNSAGPNLYTGHEIKIVARTIYAGKDYRGVSTTLNLAP